MLLVESVHVSYGQAVAVRGADLKVNSGQVVGLIGSNGAGKSTLLNCISGLIRPKAGRIVFEGENITRRAAHRITRYGVVHVPEGRQIFTCLTVRENLEVASPNDVGRQQRAAGIEKVFDIFPALAKKRSSSGGTLSGGQQQMLAIGRALMSRPRLLMLDEPSLGLAPVIVDEVFASLRLLQETGVTILIVEQNAARALDFVDYCYVIERGVIVNAGRSHVLANDDRINEQFLATPKPSQGE